MGKFVIDWPIIDSQKTVVEENKNENEEVFVVPVFEKPFNPYTEFGIPTFG